MADSNPLEYLAAGAGSAVTSTGLQMLGQSYLSDREQAQYKQNQALNYKYSQMAQINAAANTRAGLEKAGLSPALMNAGNFSPAQMSAAPMQNKQISAPSLDGVSALLSAQQSSLMEEQKELVHAQRNNVEADTDSKDIDNARKAAEDSVADSALRGSIDKLLKDSVGNPELYSYAQGLKKYFDTHNGNVGSFAGLQRLSDYVLHLDKNKAESLEVSLLTKVNELKLKNGSAQVLARMPSMTQRKILSEISHTNADIGLIMANKDLSEADVLERVERISKEATERIKTYHSDAAAMVDNGDWKAFVSSIGAEALSKAAEGLGFAAGLRVFGRGKGGSPVDLGEKALHSIGSSEERARRAEAISRDRLRQEYYKTHGKKRTY